jgi:hypothetical protein
VTASDLQVLVLAIVGATAFGLPMVLDLLSRRARAREVYRWGRERTASYWRGEC